ncbi:MAG: hypothetical protein A3J65_01170 [Candidatus Buchananbacteria bacterium RIFCSPHIGHO2_02_FULL_45_11b]|uniref:Uncharacterized protein n=4 Tax=Candidatus Buchananiibacteriota TaxID=1817903 RepID=A0A1G1YI18_9BACT|nr:MAG: hypothetical protein A2663_03080 [Candidatus Buchananbacteria bacterium RIFCSPHIGHO2_01_FULL_46_12]OGY51456.1 MAG: hypothetical protein A3J65_01170 [Candidatus Buchananbacteria bacterium RIFCSPHIGHO2_02_FULL_45_11b]OGY53821.1 MAG: hypothetical protein A3B15_00830 [Candidatus Buchananbacteria bacterium RIFCSPLOWO2_01_FULL_45_31]OGY58039.1 MAG: hypothetical protein A3H67_01050 [Candidatus Buchananbacteria bacterium RIFCSPLOWO2_02_FULL_46_11b]
MTDERWENIIDRIKDNFELTDRHAEDLPEKDGRGTAEIVEFIGPLGKMKLERTTQPLLLGKKTLGSKRIGSQTTVEYLYSDTETTHRFRVFRYDEVNDNWQEMAKEKSEMMF